MAPKCITKTEVERMRQIFTKELQEFYKERLNKPEWDSKRIADVIQIIEEYEEETTARDPTHYYYHTVYEVKQLDGQKILTNKKNNQPNKITKIVPSEEYFDILLESHLSTGHGGRDKLNFQLKEQLIYIPSTIVAMFPKHCMICQSKRLKKMTRLVTGHDYRRGTLQVFDLTNMPDNTDKRVTYNYIMYYQDRVKKFTTLYPLVQYCAEDIALELMRLFYEMGGPEIINSSIDDGFMKNVIKILAKTVPGPILVGKIIPPEERDECEQRVKNRLLSWMAQQKTADWHKGIYIVAKDMNSEFDEELGRTPFQAVFGVAHKSGLDVTDIPAAILKTLHTDVDLERWLAIKEKKSKQKKRKMPRTTSKRPKLNNSNVSDQARSCTNKSYEPLWCWVCEKDDKLVIYQCHSCNGPVHECCGKYEDAMKTVLECNLCLDEKNHSLPDGNIEDVNVKMETVEVTETIIG